MARLILLNSGFLRRYRLRDANGAAIDLSDFRYVGVVYRQGHSIFKYEYAPSFVIIDATLGIVEVLFTPDDLTGQEGQAIGIFRLRDFSNNLFEQNAPTFTVASA